LEAKYGPVLLSLITVAVLCFVIIFLVAGFTKKGWAAFGGAFGVAVFTWIIPMFFGS